MENINPNLISQRFHAYLRGRLTLRGKNLRRKPWTYGDNYNLFNVTHASILISDTQQFFSKLPKAYRTFRYRAQLCALTASV
jgi:hypothetical protein